MSQYGKYIVYVDESGDHSLSPINKEYPVFVLAFCIFEKHKYSIDIVPKLKEFKFKHFGHDMVVLHENEIRRDKGEFKILNSKDKKDSFISELTDIIKNAEFTLISAVINKEKLGSGVGSPYDLALKFCMERTYFFLRDKNEANNITHIVVEQRGKREDESLELEFRRICDGYNYRSVKMNFEIVMANKLSNSAGLQLADLVARPIGLNVIKPDQENRAFEILKQKFRSSNGVYNGYGYKIYP